MSHRAFSLVELLVVIVIIALLLALVLPAVNSSREAARRSQCSYKVRQLCIGLANHEGVHGNFPPGVPLCGPSPLKNLGIQAGNPCDGPTWAVATMAFTEEADLWEKAQDCMSQKQSFCDDCEHAPWFLGAKTPTILHCPSAPQMSQLHRSDLTGLEDLAKGNYAANYGSWKYAQAIEGGPPREANGVPKEPGLDGPDWSKSIGILSAVWLRRAQDAHFASNRGTKVRSIKDGLSKTMIISELYGVDRPADLRGIWLSGAVGGAAFTAYNPPNAARTQGRIPHAVFEEHTIILGDRIGGCATRIEDPRLQCQISSQDGNEWAAARSKHPGGVVVGLADSSVSFITDDIALVVWQAMASRAGEQQF